MSDLTLCGYPESPKTTGEPHIFMVCVDVIDAASGAVPGEGDLGKLVRRRLKRIERTLDLHSGTLAYAMNNGFLVTFASAEAALYAACDMQQCCAAIPQIPGTRIGIRIGIDAGPEEQHNASIANAASRLAVLADIGSIVIAAQVADDLPATLSQKTAPLLGQGAGASALSFDWKNFSLPPRPAPPKAARSKQPAAPRTTRIVLRRNGKALRIPDNLRIITIGRDTANDIVIDSPEVSRKHCRIVIQNDAYVLVDESTNGTYVTPRHGAPLHVKHKMLTLGNAGWIALGHPHDRDNTRIIEFQIRAVKA